MAVWQFSVDLVPRAPILARFGKIPAQLPDEDDDGWLWAFPLPADYPSVIESFTQPYPSWSAETRMWGQESGDRVHVIYDEERVVGINCRLDLRRFSPSFVRGVLRLAAHCDCLLAVGAMQLIYSNWESLSAAIRESDTMKFVADPRTFLTGLAGGQSSLDGSAESGVEPDCGGMTSK